MSNAVMHGCFGQGHCKPGANRRYARLSKRQCPIIRSLGVLRALHRISHILTTSILSQIVGCLCPYTTSRRCIYPSFCYTSFPRLSQQQGRNQIRYI